MATSALDQLRGLLRMWFYGPEGPRGTNPPPEPSMDALMNVCCGPRLLSKALHLHGEDVSADSSNGHSAEDAKPRE
jgi:hypothetical protein